MAPDHYAILGVDPKASAAEIKRAYRRLALATHPDRHPDDPIAEERFRQISVAYTILSDPAKRARYDTTRHLPEVFEGSTEMNLQTAKDLLSAVFGDVLGRQRRRRRRGRDIRYTLTIDFSQAIVGAEEEIQFEALGPCSTCSGSGVRPGGRDPETCSLCGGRGEIKGEGFFSAWTPCGRCGGLGLSHPDPCESCRGRGARRESRAFRVKIPPGTESGAQRIVRGQGEPGYFGGEAGNLLVTINVRDDPWLRREENDLHCDLWLSPAEAIRGGKVPVPTISGKVMVEIPRGVASGAKLRLRGKGVPRERGRAGDQIVTVVVETPRLDALRVADAARTEYEAHLRGLAELEGAHPDLLPRRSAQRGQPE